MQKLFLIVLMLMPHLIIAQSDLNVTGRVSLRTTNTEYDEHSEIKPDSIADREYGKTMLIPGLQQNLNLALFARTQKMDLTLLGDIRNDDWNQMQLSDFRTINRLTLSARFGSNEIVIGDFFEAGSEYFIQSREIRGAKIDLKFDNIWNSKSYLHTKSTGGIVQKAFDQGSRLLTLYKQYESSGQYRRYFTSAEIELGEYDRYSFGVSYLYSKDDESSIDESINDPLANQTLGVHSSVYLWGNHLKVFGEGYLSHKDTLTASESDDSAYKAGFDLRMNRLKFIAYYHRIGYDYYTAGYPFLLNDLQGAKLIGAYRVSEQLTLGFEAEQYDNNLNDYADIPTTTTKTGNLEFTTNVEGWPELSIRYGIRDDNSKTITLDDTLKIKTSKISRKWEGRITHKFAVNRLSLSATWIDLDDGSLLAAGAPLGTEQFVSTLNFYTRPSNSLFVSAGAVYSRLLMSNVQDNRNIYFYESSRWDILPQKLKFESTLSYIYNDAANGGVQDYLSDYDQIGLELSLEYFFTSGLSLKIIAGTDQRDMKYTTEEALSVIADPDYGPTYFNVNESYNAMIYGAEINWIF